MQPSTDYSILIVDDEAAHLEFLAQRIASFGYQVETAKDGLEAIKLLEKTEYSIIITDMVMPHFNGMDLIQHVKRHYPQVDIIAATGFTREFSFTDVINAGATDFLEKPIDKEVLQAKLQRVIRERNLIAALKLEAEERKKSEKALQLAKEEAEKGNKAKSSFINTVSHELKTPMNGIMGLTSILLTTDLTDQQRGYLEGVSESSDRLINIINQILAFSEMDIQESILHPNHFQLPRLFDDLLTQHKPKAKEKGLILAFVTDEPLSDGVIFGDSDHLLKILNNLINNAIKFSEQGEITICGKVKEQINSNKHLFHFSVEDQGCGIPLGKQEIIFKAFTQADYYMTRRHSGSGLGLAICSKLIRIMNGEIWVESKPNKGSTFNFTLPMELN